MSKSQILLRSFNHNGSLKHLNKHNSTMNTNTLCYVYGNKDFQYD